MNIDEMRAAGVSIKDTAIRCGVNELMVWAELQRLGLIHPVAPNTTYTPREYKKEEQQCLRN